MKTKYDRLAGAVALAVLASAAPAVAHAQNPFVWENSTELAYVSTGGNSAASSVGLKATLHGTGEPNEFKVEVGGIKSSTDFKTRLATGTPTSFTVAETTTHQVTAENYYLRGRYDRELSRAFAFAGVGWDRNTFAGVQNRYAFVAGIGRTIRDNDVTRLKVDIGGTYTIQKDVDPAPGADDAFGGMRLTLEVKRALSESTDYEGGLVVDQNLEDTDDSRADIVNSLTMALTSRLAFKTSVQLLYDSLPSLLSVPLVDVGGTPQGTVLTPGEKLDRIVTLTLVIKL